MTEIANLPFWELVYDGDGHPEAAAEATFLREAREKGITDVIVFAHGWNTNRTAATRLYEGFFRVLARQLQHVPAGRTTKVGLVGVMWPSQRWSDEPIPDFDAPARAAGDGGGAASVTDEPRGEVVLSAELDAATLADLKETFPASADVLDDIAALLAGPRTTETEAEFLRLMKELAAREGATHPDAEVDRDDGEEVRDGTERANLDAAEPGMLLDDPSELFDRFGEQLAETLLLAGVDVAGDGDGAAGLGDLFGKTWNGAKEALRQLTYWQMKNRAGTVGRRGLGPMLGRLNAAMPGVRVHLVGHSFGARLVSYALAGMPAGLNPSPVKGVTLIQGAFSQWAFASQLPFAAGKKGALDGALARIDGPLAVVHSRHDGAVGTFYPLASMAARDNSAGIGDANSPWGGIGANGAQGVQARRDSVRGAGPGNTYPFVAQRALNVDASDIVREGRPPVGAHSDIVHPELTWIVLSAGGIVAP